MTEVFGGAISPPDQTAVDAVRARLGAGTTLAYGRLAELAALLAGAGARAPVHTVLLRPTAGAGRATRADELADDDGVGVRDIDPGADVETALDAGRAAVDREVDAGADLLLVAADGRAERAAGRALVSVLTGTEPVHLVQWPTAGADAEWMQDLVAVRDLRRRAAPRSAEAAELLEAIGDPPLALLAGMLVQAAVRRTLVVLDGVATCAAALAAHRLAPAALAWWVGADRSLDPAAVLVTAQLGLLSVLDLDVRTDDGTAALLAAHLLASAGQVAAVHR